jgi:hypothetical protein
MELHLKKTSGYTVNSSDSEYASSDKGLYRNYNYASTKAKGSGWYGADGEVRDVEVWQDQNGELYSVKHVGKFQDDEEEFRKNVMNSIKSKLTQEELKILGIK